MEDFENNSLGANQNNEEIGRFSTIDEVDIAELEGFNLDEAEQTPATATYDGGPERAEAQLSALARYVGQKLGSDQIRVNLGEESLVKHVSELSEHQLLKLLDYTSNQVQTEIPEIDENEMAIIQGLRTGGWDYLKSQIEQFAPDQASDDELIAAFLTQGVEEEVTDEELSEAIENFKQDSLFEKRIKNLRSQYNQYQQNQKVQAAQQNLQQTAGAYQELGNRVLNDGFLDFDLNDEDGQQALQQAYGWLTQLDENGETAFDSYVRNPEGRFTASLAIAALPGIKKYVEQLHEQIDRLEAGQKKTMVTRTKQQDQSREMIENFDKMFPDMSLKKFE